MPQDHGGDRKVVRPTLSKRAARGAALAVLAICAGIVTARAGDDDMSSSPSFYDEMLQMIGLDRGTNIEYSERSPLVVPPTRDLPPPMADRPPPIPDWPKDPDMARRAKTKAKAKVKPHPDYVLDSSRPLRPDELAVPGLPGRGSDGGSGVNPESQPITPAVTQPNKKSIFSFDFLRSNKEEYATFTGEPARTSLTDPPTGYLTPSPDEPYGIAPEHKKYKIPTAADRAEPAR